MTPWLAALGDHLWYAGIGAALVLIIEFWVQELREERSLQRLRREVQARQRREAWERHVRHACAHLVRERRSRRRIR